MGWHSTPSLFLLSLSIYIFIWNARTGSQPVYTLAWELEALYQEHRILDLPYPYLG
jgi:hypothetical protein